MVTSPPAGVPTLALSTLTHPEYVGQVPQAHGYEPVGATRKHVPELAPMSARTLQAVESCADPDQYPL